jgi:hypothetical protein
MVLRRLKYIQLIHQYLVLVLFGLNLLLTRSEVQIPTELIQWGGDITAN